MSSPPRMPAFDSSTVYQSPFTYPEPFPATHDASRSRSHSASRPSPENRSRAGTYRNAVPTTHGRTPSSNYAAQFPGFDDAAHHHENGDLGSNGIEMNEPLANRHSPHLHQSKGTPYSTTMDFPSTAIPEEVSFLHGSSDKIDSFYSNGFVPYKEDTSRQLRHILIGGSARWVITLVLCVVYGVLTIVWAGKGPVSEASKRAYNTMTTGLAIALGLNVASAFKDLALDMRWPILNSRKRNLLETDLILHADSLQKLFKLCFTARRPTIILACIAWLSINLLAQAGIAMLSLTYGFETDTDNPLMGFGNASTADMRNFYLNQNVSDIPAYSDQAFLAHSYGLLGWPTSYSTNDKPAPATLFSSLNTFLFENYTAQRIDLIFLDSPANSSGIGNSDMTVYTERGINATWTCSSQNVTAYGPGYITTSGSASNISVWQIVEQSANYFVNPEVDCGPRCVPVQAYEPYYVENPYNLGWYYQCNLTLGSTFNDPNNVSYISDDMALLAMSSIASQGVSESVNYNKTYNGLQELQNYPQTTFFGTPQFGNANGIGALMTNYGLGAIAGAMFYNPPTSYKGNAPSQGQHLKMGHSNFFFVILGLIVGLHLFLVVIVAFLANRVKVGPEGHLSMSILLRPIADVLYAVSKGHENKALRDMKHHTSVRYRKNTRTGKWELSMN